MTYIERGLEAAVNDADEETALLVHGRRPAARPRRRHPSAAGAGQRRHPGGRRPGAAPRRRGHRPVPHRAHVPRRPPGAHRAGHPGRHRQRSATRRWRPCCRCSAQDFVEILEAMDGLPVTIRLLDPPLHEFLPDLTELSVRVAVARGARQPGRRRTSPLLAAVERLHESNPMLGLRGVRLGLVVPGLFALQVRAIAEAAVARIKAGGEPQGRDHGPAGRVGDGAAPRRRRDRRHRRTRSPAARTSRWSSRSAR